MMLIYGCQFLLFRYEKRKRKKFISELITWDVMEGAPSLFRERCDGEGERKKVKPIRAFLHVNNTPLGDAVVDPLLYGNIMWMYPIQKQEKEIKAFVFPQPAASDVGMAA